MSNNKIVVDSDVMNYFNELPNGKDHFSTLMKAIDRQPVMHIFVKKEELYSNKTVENLISSDGIEIIDYPDFLTDENKQLYKEIFGVLYASLNSESLPKYFNIFTGRLAEKNMGEIHSCILAQYLDIDILFSNDHGAKDLANQFFNVGDFKLKVKTLQEILVELGNEKSKLISKEEAIAMMANEIKARKNVVKRAWQDNI
jgi:hypothetical protein